MINKSNDINLVPIKVLKPIGMGQSGLVLHDSETGKNNSIIESGLEQISNFNTGIINPDNAAINIENSSDVIIGPVTQFNGPVTIYQNANGPQQIKNNIHKNYGDVQFGSAAKLVKSESTSSEVSQTPPASNSPETEDHSIKKNNNFKYIIAGFGLPLLILLITGVVIAGVVSSKHKGEPDYNPQPHPQPEPEPPIHRPIQPPPVIKTEVSTSLTFEKHRLIYRNEWGGRLALNFTKPLKHPTPLVIISHTASSFCTTFTECSIIVVSAQEYHVGTFGSPDIGYNFLIGGDGNIYVGRGWDIRNFHQDGSIGISFIGNFLFDELNPEMIEAADFLINQGVELGKLAEDYEVICHNQTMATQSPGYNVYKVVSKWPHFSNKKY